MFILHDLAKSGNNLLRLRELLEAGENPNSRDGADNTPLHIASLIVVQSDDLEGNLQIARELIRFGAGVDEKNRTGFSPLHFAVASRKTEMVRLLLQAKADINIRNEKEQTPLMLAAKFQNFQIVEELLKQHASVNLQDWEGDSEMHYILSQRSVEKDVVVELLRHQCDHTIMNRDQMMPLDLYLQGLVEAPFNEVLKARDLFKQFLFQRNYFTTRQLELTNSISYRSGIDLGSFYNECCKEVAQMKDDFLSFDCTVHTIAMRGFHNNKSKIPCNVSIDVYDSMLDRLIKGKYPIYHDILVSDICTLYLRNKFSEVCSSRENNRGILSFDVLFLISSYLSHLQIQDLPIYQLLQVIFQNQPIVKKIPFKDTSVDQTELILVNYLTFKIKMSILHHLIRARDQDGRLQTFRERLAAGEDPNAESSQGTPLFLLAFNNATNPQDMEVHLQMARELIIFGADVNVQDGLGWTPLIVAVIVRNLRMFEFLLDVNAEVNLRDNNGNTALHHAVESGRFQISERNDVVTYNRKIHIVKTLIRFNSELERVNNLNQTPLMLAVKDQDYLIVKQLLKNNASPKKKDMYNNSLMHYALGRTNVSLDIVSELVRHRCRFSSRNRYRDTSMSVYVKHLSNASPAELEKAKYVFKVFLLDENEFTEAEISKIDEISRDTNCNLFNYCQRCYKEISGMIGDKLTKKCYIYTLATSGIYCKNIKDEPSMFDIYDKVLNKLFKGKYPVYCDVIVSGISRKYLNKEFVETCCSVEITGIGFLSIDTLCLLTSYLSNVDMFNMMRACCPDKRWSKSSHCSIM
ncbi:uncharacterized protein LOC129985004 [Argiope bruennichi]|uniref:uncharacterized protein LOC129985004 n=1 Tax=Argiope bruennichi TaxID=94029 RepID=UPI00249510CA|nr:uncharacterized protein LOC129985004 [Argiope bruennichi]